MSRIIVTAQAPQQKPRELLPFQVEHSNRIADILTGENSKDGLPMLCYVDCSRTGCGKTTVAILTAKRFDMNIGVIVPDETIAYNWHRESKACGVTPKFVITMGKLKSKKGNSLLFCYPDDQDSKAKRRYKTTELYRNMLTEPFLLIVDEIHNLKNWNVQTKAVTTMTREILKSGGTCRMALLSATPYDKQEHVINLFRIMGIINKDKMADYNVGTGEYKLIGYQDLLTYATHLDKRTTNMIINDIKSWKGKYGHTIAHRMFVEIMKPRMISVMKAPKMLSGKDYKNGYYIFLDDDEEERYNIAVYMLSKATGFRQDTQEINIDESSFGAIQSALMNIELAKIPILIRKALETLDDDPNSKVIIYCSYNQTIDTIASHLEEYNPIIFNGKTKPEDRVHLVNAFNKPDNHYRVLIGNIKVGKQGINLHDTDGCFPRTMFIVPTYSIIDLHQAVGRIYRVGTKSLATVRFVYGEASDINKTPKMLEKSIINALSRKRQVLKDSSDIKSQDENVERMLYPGEYGNVHENGSPDDDDYGIAQTMDSLRRRD
jgi:superfamily II DNA or RNA helicase